MSLHRQLEAQINAVIHPYVSGGVEILNPNDIADQVRDLIDPDHLAPELMDYASLMFLRDAVRHELARNYDPVEKARRQVSKNQDDMFSTYLQDYYPVKRTTESESLLFYAHIETLTDDDVDRICSRMTKAGHSLIRHADALREYQERRAA